METLEESSNEESDDDDYEYEELDESPLYFSDFSDSFSLSEDDLEYNP
jgi:hypothetical protein